MGDDPNMVAAAWAYILTMGFIGILLSRAVILGLRAWRAGGQDTST